MSHERTVTKRTSRIAQNAVIAALVAAGCTAPPSPPHGTTALSLEARQDVAAVVKASSPGVPTALEMSNPVHYRFLLQQLAAAGYTRELYPELYQVTEHARTVPAPKLLRAAAADLDDPPIEPIQTFTGFGTADGINYEAAAISSVPGDPSFSLLVVQIYDNDLNPLGPAAVIDSATAPATDLDVVASGAAAAAFAPTQAIATYLWEDNAGNAFTGTITAEVSARPVSIINDAPMPAAGQSITKLCLGRQGADCTYQPVGGSGTNVLMPVKGSVEFNLPISKTGFKTAQISIAKPAQGQGGGCTIRATTDFFADPDTIIAGNRISWNLKPAQFQPATNCLTANARAIYTFALGLTVGTEFTIVIITSNNDTEPKTNYDLVIPELEVFFSCIAEGTDVQLAGGAPVKIEELVSGQSVAIDRLGHFEQVTGKLHGTESVPMVRLKTRGGHDLLLTEGHPVITADRGPVFARDLAVGATVMTVDGPDPLVSVTRERSDRPVWNLNVGTPPASMEDASVTGRTFFAGGIQVGDNIMQFVENRKHQLAAAAAAAPPIPAKWRTDYQSSIAAAHRTAKRPAL